MKKNGEDEKSKLNNMGPEINRGVELLLRKRRKKPEVPKIFQVKFGKIISFFKQEIDFFFEFHLDIRKKN